MKWEIISKLKNKKNTVNDIVSLLLSNRGITTQEQTKDFFLPTHPNDVDLNDLNISKKEVEKTIKRISHALEKKEKVFIYGDYDADGVCATGILWETLYSLNLDVTPFIPDRFLDGYGLNANAVEKLKVENPTLSLIITVDNGIVADKAVSVANKLGIDVIVTDHHLENESKPAAHSIIHTTQTSGAGISWILSREILKKLSPETRIKNLDLAAIGVIADQMPLTGVNRAFAKYGVEDLRKTERPGLTYLYEAASVNPKDIETYHINYIIAPRINAMGRIKHGIDSLRFLCTKNSERAYDLSRLVGETNEERQKIVEQVVNDARKNIGDIPRNGVIVLASETYHEGVIGLAAARIVEEFYRPTIVFSVGEITSKASARSVPGFNIIESLRQLSELWEEGGGHAMAAGFTLKTDRIAEFGKKLNGLAGELLTDELLERKMKIDMEIDFENLDWDLAERLKQFEPFGLGNPNVVFATRDVEVDEVRAIGNGAKHLKIKLRKGKVFDSIYFGAGAKFQLKKGDKVDIAYTLEINEWNGNKSLQLKLKDLNI